LQLALHGLLLSRKFAEKLVLPVLGADDEVCDKEIQVSIWDVDTYFFHSNFLQISFFKSHVFKGK
jgi:hypothetical protein